MRKSITLVVGAVLVALSSTASLADNGIEIIVSDGLCEDSALVVSLNDLVVEPFPAMPERLSAAPGAVYAFADKLEPHLTNHDALLSGGTAVFMTSRSLAMS